MRGLTGKVIKFEPSSLGDTAESMEIMSELHLKTTTELKDADIVCAAHFENVSLLSKLYVYLNGGLLAQFEYISSHGKAGTCLAMAPAARARKHKVWVSALFAERNLQKVDVIMQAVDLPGSKWTWFVGANHEFLTKAMRDKSAIGIVTNCEYSVFPQGVASVMTCNGFLHHICTVSSESCIFGK